ncbi:hypothetical protein NKH77_39170 [Streptomyces sp. M19]
MSRARKGMGMPGTSTDAAAQRPEQMRTGWRPHHTLWIMLLGGWLFSYADRTITGPVVTWLIDNDHGMLGASSHPHALGGLIGSLFFAGYMLTQFPGGYLGDRPSHDARGVAAVGGRGDARQRRRQRSDRLRRTARAHRARRGRLLLNDRTLIAQRTPPAKVSLGMGVAITGLSIGLTIATISAPT